MVKMNVKFETPEQLVEFSRMCQKVEADTLIEDTAHKLIGARHRIQCEQLQHGSMGECKRAPLPYRRSVRQTAGSLQGDCDLAEWRKLGLPI